MNAAAEVFIKIGADSKALTAGFEKAKSALKSLGDTVKTTSSQVQGGMAGFRQSLQKLDDRLHGIDRASGVYRDAMGKLRQANGQFVSDAGSVQLASDRLTETLKTGIAAGLLATGAAMAFAGHRAVTLAAELEQNKVAFTTMLGSAEKAETMLNNLATFAANTPFELRGLTDSTKRLMAFGFNAESVLPIMEAVGNAVAGVGGGKATLDGVTLALGQMQAKGKVAAQEMNQLAERGIPAWEMLSKSIGVSIPEAMKMAEKGSLDAGTAITALVAGMNQRFPDMMAKQSKTFNGALSNLQDAADIGLTRIGKKITESLNLVPIIQHLSLAIQNLTAAFQVDGLIGAINTAFGPSTQALMAGVTAGLVLQMLPAIKAIGVAFRATSLAALPALATAGAFAFAAYPIIKNWGYIAPAIGEVLEWIAGGLQKLFGMAVKITTAIGNALGGAFATVAQKISGWVGETVNKGFKWVGSAAAGAADNFADTWGDALTMARGLTRGLFTDMSAGTKIEIPKLTKAMLGVKNVAIQSADAQKKAAKAAQQAAKEAAAETISVGRKLANLLRNFGAQQKASAALAADIRKVRQEQERLGRVYDVSGGLAKAYSRNLGEIQKAFGELSPQAEKVRQAIARLNAESEGGGAATAGAFLALREADEAINNAILKAQALGEAYDENAIAAEEYSKALGKVISLGLKPGAEAFDEAAKKAKNSADANKQATITANGLIDAYSQSSQAIATIASQALKAAEALGVDLTSGIGEFAAQAVTATGRASELAIGIGQIAGAVSQIANAWATDWRLGALVTGLMVIGIVGGYVVDQWTEANKAQEKARLTAFNMRPEIQAFADQMIANNQKIKEMYEATQANVGNLKKTVADAMTTATYEFMLGIDGWADRLEEKLKQAMFEGLMNKLVMETITKGLEKDFEAIAEAVMTKNYKLATSLTAQLTEKTKGMIEPVAKAGRDLLEGLGLIGGEADATIQRALGGARAAVSQANKAQATAVGTLRYAQQGYLDELTRLSNVAGGRETEEYKRLLARANETAEWIRNLNEGKPIPATFKDAMPVAVAPGLAAGGLVKSPTVAIVGEGRDQEAVLPLNDSVFRQIAMGISAQQQAAGGAHVTVNVNYTGNGKWTREDAAGLGRLMVAELRTMGVRA